MAGQMKTNRRASSAKHLVVRQQENQSRDSMGQVGRVLKNQVSFFSTGL